MRWIKLILVSSLALIAINSFAQKERKYIRQGNKEFDNSMYENSEISYRKAADLEEEKSHKTAFNVGDALYKQEKYEDAIKQFNSLADLEISKEEKAKIYHNLGNSLMQTEKFKESIDAYKNALRNNPNDMDTKYNLVYAQKKLDEQQKQDQNQDQNKDENIDQDKDQNQDKENQDQDKNEDKKDQEQNQDKQDQNKDEQEQQQPEISKEDAERILQALAEDEKDTQQKVKEQKAAAAKVKSEKEW
ncbi:MAG: tetratricopeptide repeat protein [Bacteroidales bacterium]|jgi:Ca-activated chloride channel family protein|nr:tetratricopeptide repeat protein [Bacteroidales bacterium]